MYKFLAFILLINVSSFSQTLKINYIAGTNDFIETQTPTILYVDSNYENAFYVIESSKTKMNSKNVESEKEDELLLNNLQAKKIIINKYSFLENTYASFSKINDQDFLVVDALPIINWEFQNDTKKIMDLTCFKATGYFRGRNWIAWFSTDFPIPIGPSKFHGLPGLILELYDEENKYYINASKIELSQQDFKELSLGFNNQFKDSYKRKSLKDFKSIEKENNENIRQTIIERDENYVQDSRKHGMELKYEWEE